MKQILITALTAVTLFGCNTSSTSTTTGDSTLPSTPSADEKIEYAYTIEHPADNWTPGDQKHVATALRTLKAYENGDITECVKGFGDTVKVYFDQYEATLSNDSLKAMFEKSRAAYKNVKINMDDWETVISKDKSKEYVSLWYKEIRTDQQGKVDSVECMDDLLMKDGKIVSLNEKTRKFAVKK